MAAPHINATPTRRRVLAAAAVVLAAGTFGATAGYARDASPRQPAPVTVEQAMQEYREMIIALYGPQSPPTKGQTESCSG